MSETTEMKVMFYEITKGDGDHAQIGEYRDLTIGGNDFSQLVSDSVNNDCLPAAGGFGVNNCRELVPGHHLPDWSIMAESNLGKHAYVFRLDNESVDPTKKHGAYFADQPNAIMCLSEYCPPFERLIFEVDHYCVPGENESTWASFIFDCSDVAKLEPNASMRSSGKRSDGGPENRFIDLPLHLNLIDKYYGVPLWMLGNHPHPHPHPHPNKNKIEGADFHPGFHPPSFLSPFVVTL